MKNCVNQITKITIKCLTVLAILAIGFLSVFSAPLMNVLEVLAETNYNNHIASGLKLLNLPKSAKLNQAEKVNVPFGESDNANDIINVKIFDPKNNLIFDNLADDKSGFTDVTIDNGNRVYKLDVKKVGTYKVQYSVESSIGKKDLAIQEYKIVVTGDKAELSFEENTKQIIPSVTNDSYQVVLPNPVVTDSEGNEVSEAQVLQNLVVTIKDTYTNTTHSSANSSDTLITKLDNAEIDGTDVYNYAFTPNSEADCTYIITYNYTDSISGLQTSEVFEIKYEKEFKSEDIKLGYKFVGSMPESMELGVETALPTVSIYDENDADLKLTAYTDVKVVFIPNESSKANYTDKLETDKDYVLVANTNKFTPIYSTKDGVYKITYNIYNFYGLGENEVSKTLVYTINDVKDSKAPVTYVVDDYTSFINFDADDKVESLKDNFEIKDVSYKIPTKVATNTTVFFPAIFATDEVSGFEKMYGNFKRAIVTPNDGTKYLENDTNNPVKFYETASYEFKTAGTYTIRYEAKDEANKSNLTGTVFTIVVEDGFEDITAPKITLNNVPTNVKSGETISFLKPTVVDFASESVNETSIVDKNLEIGYYYYTGSLDGDSLNAELNKARNGEGSALVKVLEDEEDKTKLSFVAPNSNDVTFVAVAYDDANNRAVLTKTINILNVIDTSLPTVVTNDEDLVDGLLAENLSQDEKINIPTFVMKDGANTKYLEGSVKVLDKDGKSVSVIGAKYVINTQETEDTSDDTFEIQNARFVATKAGEYTIVYTINDIGGNYIIKSYMVSVADTKEPTIELNGSISTVEVGESKKLPAITVKDNNEVLTDAHTEVRFIGDNNPSYKFNNGTMEFTALETGVFTYEYYTEDSAGNYTISGPYTFEAKDTNKPTITLDRDLNSEKTYPIEKDGEDNILPIEIPGYTAEDVLNGVYNSEVIVKSPSDKSLKVEKTDNGYKFTPTVDGIYTVIYTATDNANNKEELTYSLKIGDNTAPSVSIENLEANAPSELKVNKDKLILDLENITVSDAGTTKTANELLNEYTNNGYKMFTVTVTGPDGSTITGEDYEYEISQTGKYTITYTARDKANNEKVIKKYVEVYADDNGSVITTETWSIVLIVVSLAVLGGVVIYFIKTRDKKPTKASIVKLNKDDNKKD